MEDFTEDKFLDRVNSHTSRPMHTTGSLVKREDFSNISPSQQPTRRQLSPARVIPGPRRRNSPQGRRNPCYICGSHGHFWKECTETDQYGWQPGCPNCEELDYILGQCVKPSRIRQLALPRRAEWLMVSVLLRNFLFNICTT